MMKYPNRNRRSRARAMTLIEVLIVLALLALMVGAVLTGTGQTDSARIRHSSTMIVGAVRVAYTRATSTSKHIRLVFDMDENQIWLEQGDQPMLVQSKDTSGTGGANAATVAERDALAESSRIVKGPTPPRASFTEIDPMGLVSSEPGKAHKALEKGIRIWSVQTQHDAEPRRTCLTDPPPAQGTPCGRAYLYFWPGGQTERASIQLKPVSAKPDDDSKIVTLIVSPLTGRVAVKDGAVPLPDPHDAKEASEREDPGAF